MMRRANQQGLLSVPELREPAGVPVSTSEQVSLTPLCHVCGLFGLGYGVEKFVDSFLARHEKWLAHPSPQPLSQ